MPRKPTKKAVEESSEVQSEVAVQQEKKKSPDTQETQKKRGRKPASNSTVSSAVTTSTVSASESEVKKRVVPTRESVDLEFNSLSSLIEDEINNLKNTKSSGVKFLRTVNKRLKLLKVHSSRISNKRKASNRTNTGNSGFLKPVKISDQLSDFTGWKKEEPKSRVEVTKYICNYIKEKKLQNPDDRRQILVDKDSSLKKLLGYPRKGETKPLTYYTLQTYLKNHFPSKEQ